MSNCAIDHTQQDVVEKLAEQRAFMPEKLVKSCELFLSKSLSQETLNEVFHLLKKYDLATETERAERDNKMQQLFI
ncbi:MULTISPECIES: group-specific protein [unclassified Sporosarcina]|uniref:group-specific protein n=1 Tax=unclassified Sporosarcina TaxID=2647733 RepID=UPI000C170486|nr:MULTISPECIES: group-specific protein [unclassified Sporosarcina]PID03221.1 group-specific protein [Sporosarcina sp. P2]PID26219.1 group-specific protein [Sporosarcina sp. P7]